MRSAACDERTRDTEQHRERLGLMADLNTIAETLSGLTVMEAAELAKLLEEKWGVSAAAPVAVAAVAGAAPAAAAEEKTEEAVAKTTMRPPASRCISL